MTSDGIVSVIWGDTGLVDRDELGCPSTWVTKETVACASEEI